VFSFPLFRRFLREALASGGFFPYTGQRSIAEGGCVTAKTCFQCGQELTGDEIALYRKLFNRGAQRFLCLRCQASHFGVTEELLRQKIREFREYGCTLFS